MKSRTVKRLFREDILPYLKSRPKKSYLRQLRELFELYRTHRALPYQYVKTGIYAASFQAPVRDYVPPRLIYKYMETINASKDQHFAKDKVAFRRLLAEAGLPVIREFFHVDRNGNIFDADLHQIDAAQACELARAHGGDIFVKPVDGTWGLGTFVLPADEISRERIAGWRNALAQPVLSQHETLKALYPHAINTIRIDTLRTGDEVINNAAVLRIGIGGAIVDNGSAGGLIAGIDLETGRVRPEARQKPKFSHRAYTAHPDTGAVFGEVTVPFWDEIRTLVARAARAIPLRSVGWDVAVTPDGPVLVETNQRWDMTVMQLGWGGLGSTEIGRRAREYHRTRRLTGGH